MFHAHPHRPGEAYTIVIPPPNVTGSLHMGHALNVTLQDVLIRYARMNGRNALWLPGMDHAGIATQNVVERELKKEGITRQELGREAFIERVWKWKEQSGGTILNQLKRLGAACDWDRERFTMDEGLSRAVKEAFVRLYRKGLIYKGRYIINWCPRCHTALSDLEVSFEEKKGSLWYIRYPGWSGGEGIVVATTRPETMLGDTAVAVNPKDERFAGMIGETLRLPLMDRPIPVVARPHGGPGVRDRRGEDHAGARRERFRGREAPRASFRPGDRRVREDDVRRRGLGGDGPVRLPGCGGREARRRRGSWSARSRTSTTSGTATAARRWWSPPKACSGS